MRAGIALLFAKTIKDRTPNPNSFDIYRRKEPIIGLFSKVNNSSMDYYRRLQPSTTLILP